MKRRAMTNSSIHLVPPIDDFFQNQMIEAQKLEIQH